MMSVMASLFMLQVLTGLIFAQAPQKMSYQAVIRDVSGKLVTNQTVGMRITILKGPLPGTSVYSETQTPTTNSNGLVTIEIGGGTGFDAINWGNGLHYIKTETDPTGGTNYTISATSQLLSVPYAIYSKTAETAKDAATKTYVDALLQEIKYLKQISGIGSVTDADGNTYKTIKINSQLWMAENLKTTKYNDGTVIPLVTDNTAWSLLTTPGYCWYGNDGAAYGSTYGALYNFYTANTGKLCPSGWHVPSDAEWTSLSTYLGGEDVAGGKMKETGTTHWYSPNSGATNESGFSGLPGGYRLANGTFASVGSHGNWWSLTEGSVTGPWHRGLFYFDDNLWRIEYPKILGFSIRCVRDAVPSVTTVAPESIYYDSAILGGEVTSDGGLAVTEKGVCYATTQNPTTGKTKVVMGSGTGIFNGKVTGLTINTTYYVRAYAINSQGTAYGEQVSFFILENSRIISDVDANNYKTVKIGTQYWMAENLKTTKYNDGTAIPLVTDAMAWSILTTPGYCWYKNDKATYGNVYGALYNTYTVNTGKLCPTGWHVPSDAEWTTLTTFLGGEALAGGKMKETGTTHWQSPNTGATNESGFSGLPGGYRLTEELVKSIFTDDGYIGNWWSSTKFDSETNYFRMLDYLSTDVNRGLRDKNGFSIRCVRDF